jgi:hypothetical protein
MRTGVGVSVFSQENCSLAGQFSLQGTFGSSTLDVWRSKLPYSFVVEFCDVTYDKLYDTGRGKRYACYAKTRKWLELVSLSVTFRLRFDIPALAGKFIVVVLQRRPSTNRQNTQQGIHMGMEFCDRQAYFVYVVQ